MAETTGAALTSRVVRYVPGRSAVVARGRVLVALPDAPLDAATTVWESLDGTPGIMDVLQAMSAAFDTSLAALPPFAAVLSAGGRTHVLVRGALDVTVERETSGDLTIEGHDVTTWVERSLDGVTGAVVRLGPDVLAAADAAAADSLLPFAGGVVRADVAVLGAPARRRRDLEVSEGSSGVVSLAESPPSSGAPVDWPVPTWARGAEPPAPTPVPSPPGDEETAQETLTDLGTIVPSAVPAAPAPDRDSDPAESSLSAASPAVTNPGEQPVPADGSDAPETGDDYGELWETTIHRSVEEAAVRMFQEDGSEAPAGLIAGVPSSFTPDLAPDLAVAEPAPSDELEQDGLDHDGHTVVSSELADLRAVAAAAGPGAPDAAQGGPSAHGGPPIVARTCAAGHVNPPARERCSVCGAAVVGDTRTLPRPALGRVKVSNGQDLELDRPLVVGRRPRSPRGGGSQAGPGGDASALHRIVTVPSPQQDISRSHVEVRLEGWHVLAVDLSTTNGTTLVRAGQAPLSMHPGDPVLVVSGDVVDLGDGATLTFEDLP
jgi:hypothetical protein